MAMTPPQPDQGIVSADVQQLLDRAAANLRNDVDDRWVEVFDRILAKALSATRQSHPVRAEAPGGTVHVSEHVLIAYLRDAIDDAVPGSAVARITPDITGRDTLSGVTIQLIAQFGVPLIPIADRVRELASSVLAELLGPVAPAVTVRTMHVHISDVTPGDPQTADPEEDPLQPLLAPEGDV